MTGAPASSYELALTNNNFKFPQLWRTNVAVDQKLPWGWSGTAEFLYNHDVNGVYYINANLAPANTAFAGADTRPRWTTANRINAAVANAIVLKNQNVGTSWNLSGSLERLLNAGLWIKTAYSYGESKNTVDPGSIAFGSWNNNQHPGDPNNPGIGYSLTSPGHRFFLATSYTKDYFGWGGTTISTMWETRTLGSANYTYSGDLNGDGGTSNDLIYIPRNTSEMNFQAYTSGTRTFTAEEQANAWETYIQQDSYLSKHRGSYTQRGAVFLPLVNRLDLTISQNIYANIFGRRNTFQVRLDIDNFGNLLNSDWGVGQRLINAQPLIVPTSAQGSAADTQGRAQYRLRAITNELMTKSLETTSFLTDVYKMMVSVRYTF